MVDFSGRRVVVTGGTGSLGQKIVHRILSGECGTPQSLTVFSRDEAKQHYMRMSYLNAEVATDEIIYNNFKNLLQFRIGNIRDYSSVVLALREADTVIHAAALKQVPACEYFPREAVQTNIIGAENIVQAIAVNNLPVKTVVGISTDKACKPVNVMGMTKSIMERIFIEANQHCPDTRFVGVRYGNVIASRGSVVPLFVSQIEKGGPVTITVEDMTRFFLRLDSAVDTIFAALKWALPGEIIIPKVPSAKIVDLAQVLIGEQDIPIEFTGIRPGEKLHEIMVSEEECARTTEYEGYYVICPMLPELSSRQFDKPALTSEYSSSNITLNQDSLRELIAPFRGEFREETP
jgi:UDP-glucose 4-epimerase